MRGMSSIEAVASIAFAAGRFGVLEIGRKIQKDSFCEIQKVGNKTTHLSLFLYLSPGHTGMKLVRE